MTLQIPKEEWGNFFDDLTRRRFEWKTHLEVFSSEIGDQILSDGLPLKGVTFEVRGGKEVVEVLLGKSTDDHQTHNIFNTESVQFLPNEGDGGGILEIEESDGTKTLVRLIEPMPLKKGYGAYWTAGA
ncbi:MAG: hypothetical protein DWQ47_01520 [Acidobacteria bacterium]|nr:MAG: hypothetical protein DWQ32_11980 [Acidobacteriota bacterium]REK04175.1 MAG: hypothetical protein DWQ38_01505 [Acidobacteriota bacterium]REK15337.1 MAG: hypothetical protein DWQ43_17670 [Acidobacteriota bacterium]REK46427.1 MAG: hypothetical protein DWQ47_01520 [Acidobacteriota bacterium]